MSNTWFQYGYSNGYNTYVRKMGGISIEEALKPDATVGDNLDAITGEMIGEMDAQFLRLIAQLDEDKKNDD